MTATATATPVLSLRGISKRFGAVQALTDVEIDVFPGEVVALVGDNGAGKSTLVKVISGVGPANEGSIQWERREYGADDLEGTFVVIAATSDTDVNIRVYEDAERRAMLVNVVDVPPLCNFILPAIVRTGPLAIAISTAGASPALAKRMKREISDLFGEEYARLAIMLNDARGWAKGTLPTYQDRKAFFEGIVNGDPDPVELLRRGDEEAVRAIIAAAQQSHFPAGV